jgi:hypothetical protein
MGNQDKQVMPPRQFVGFWSHPLKNSRRQGVSGIPAEARILSGLMLLFNAISEKSTF